jgi:hypothetical protein
MSAVEALQQALAAEHAAVHVLAELGGRISASQSPRQASLLRSAYETHRGRRDQLMSELGRLGATPTPPAPAYAVDSEDRAASHLVAVALRTEQRSAEAYAEMVAGTTGRLRRWAVAALAESARRQLTLGGRPGAFPGLAELS